MQPSTQIQIASQALVALGANLSTVRRSAAQTLVGALEVLAQETASRVNASRLYRTPAVPAESGPDYLNAAAEIRWSGTPEALLDLLHRIEADLGRTRRARWEARIVDLDLIAMGAKVCPDRKTQASWAALPLERAAVTVPAQLVLPHPRLADRGFVLAPLADIAPGWRHPVTGDDVVSMLAARPSAERTAIVPVAWPGHTTASPLSFVPLGDR